MLKHFMANSKIRANFTVFFVGVPEVAVSFSKADFNF